MRTSMLVTVVFSLLPAPVFADEVEHAIPDDPYTFRAYFENDSQALKPNDNEDRHYTNGVAVSFDHQADWAQQIADNLGGGRAGAGYIVGQLMHTPSDITDPDPDPDDQPYSGYVFGGVYWQRDNGRRHEDPTQRTRATRLDHFQIDLGYVGPESAAEDVQTEVHEIVGADEPRGWSHQLDDEFTGNIYYRSKWRWDMFGSDDAERATGGWGGQLIPYAGFALGTVHRHLEGGAVVRMGWNLPDDFGPGRIADPYAATGDPLNGCFSFYAFGRAGGRAVEHNLFLEGNNFRDSRGVDPKPFVGELQLGVAMAIRLCENFSSEVAYSQTFSTRQFRGQQEADGYGALTTSFTLWF